MKQSKDFVSLVRLFIWIWDYLEVSWLMIDCVIGIFGKKIARRGGIVLGVRENLFWMLSADLDVWQDIWRWIICWTELLSCLWGMKGWSEVGAFEPFLGEARLDSAFDIWWVTIVFLLSWFRRKSEYKCAWFGNAVQWCIVDVFCFQLLFSWYL